MTRFSTRDKDWINYAALLQSGAEPLSELAAQARPVAERLTKEAEGHEADGCGARGLCGRRTACGCAQAHASSHLHQICCAKKV